MKELLKIRHLLLSNSRLGKMIINDVSMVITINKNIKYISVMLKNRLAVVSYFVFCVYIWSKIRSHSQLIFYISSTFISVRANYMFICI